MHALNDVVQILHLAASQPDITHHDQRRVGGKPQPLFAPVAAVVEETLLQHAVFVVAQQRTVLRSGKPRLELRKVPGCQKVLPLGSGQGRAVAARCAAHGGIRRADADQPRRIGNRRCIALQLDQLPQARLGSRPMARRCQRHKRLVAAVLQKRLGLCGQAPVCSGVS